MSNIYNISELTFDTDCTSTSVYEWERLMKGSVKANGSKIRKLIKKFIPELYDSLGLDFYNPYESNSVRTKTHFIYVHSCIEYFLKF